MCLRVLSKCFLNSVRVGAVTPSLGSLSQCSTILWVKNLFLIPRWWDSGEGWREPSSLFSLTRDICAWTPVWEMASNSSTPTIVSFPEASQPSLKVFLNLSKSLPTAMSPSCPSSSFRGSLGKHFPRGGRECTWSPNIAPSPQLGATLALC